MQKHKLRMNIMEARNNIIVKPATVEDLAEWKQTRETLVEIQNGIKHYPWNQSSSPSAQL
jgi:hypothetical protein